MVSDVKSKEKTDVERGLYRGWTRIDGTELGTCEHKSMAVMMDDIIST